MSAPTIAKIQAMLRKDLQAVCKAAKLFAAGTDDASKERLTIHHRPDSVGRLSASADDDDSDVEPVTFTTMGLTEETINNL